MVLTEENGRGRLQKEKILEHFREMIRIPTVSFAKREDTDREAFQRFRKLIYDLYPALCSTAEVKEIGDFGLLFRIPGQSDKHPSVLMAHMDVVPADPSLWDADPFGAEVIDGRIYGRGTLDTKSTLWGILEAAELRAAKGLVPANDIYLSFGGEEETCGPCCREIVSFLKEKGVRPQFVLDEGGSVIPEGLPGVHVEAAVIGIAEKGTANYLLELRDKKGGHASVPPRHTVVGRLSKAAVNIENHPFPARLSTPVKMMFKELKDEAPLYAKAVFARPELFEKAIVFGSRILGPTVNAMVRTTVAVTFSESRSEFNVLPQEASLGVNVRLLEGDTVESAAKRLKATAGDPDIEVRLVRGTNPSAVAPVDTDEYRMLKEVISEVWKGVICAPYQMNGGTDARFYSELTEEIYRFSPMIMSKEERASVHGVNESIAIDNLMRIPVFYLKLMDRI